MPAARAGLLDQVAAEVRQLGARLSGGGGRAWLVGGAVRNLLLDHPVRDWDLATDLSPDALGRLLPDADHRDRDLGACRLPLSTGGTAVITSLREDSDYRDHRHPETVRFVDRPEQDARRRDFTVNAIYLDLGDGSLLDPCGGIADLSRGALRAIGDPAVRFREDALRMLRAVRFCADHGLTADPATADGVRAEAGLAVHLSAERVLQELTAAFTGRGRGRALRLLHDFGLLRVVLPEAAAMDGVTQPAEYHPEGDVLVHTCLVLDQVPEGDPALAWAAVLHDVGKPPTWTQGEDRIRFHGHDTLSATMAEAVLVRLRAPSALRAVVVDVVREHIRFAALPDMRPRRREQWMRSANFKRHLAFHRADCLGSHGDLSRYAQALVAWRDLPAEAPPPLCTGADVLACGVAQGPLVGEVLRLLHTAAEARGIADRDAALELLQTVAAPYVKEAGPGDR